MAPSTPGQMNAFSSTAWLSRLPRVLSSYVVAKLGDGLGMRTDYKHAVAVYRNDLSWPRSTQKLYHFHVLYSAISMGGNFSHCAVQRPARYHVLVCILIYPFVFCFSWKNIANHKIYV